MLCVCFISILLQEYVEQLKIMRSNEIQTMHVNFEHVQQFDDALAESISEEFYRFEPFLRRAVQALVRDIEPDFLMDEGEEREFFVAFYNTGDIRKVRDLNMKKIGCLTTFSGTVTRTTEVRPELLAGRFTCSDCGMLSPPIEQQFKLTEPSSCANDTCTNRIHWKLDIGRSRFGDWQRVRVQENADEIPPGECCTGGCSACSVAIVSLLDRGSSIDSGPPIRLILTTPTSLGHFPLKRCDHVRP